MNNLVTIKSKVISKDAEGITHTNYVEIKKKYLSIQPYTSELAKKEYGFDKIVNARTFPEPDVDINENNIIEVSPTERYIIHPPLKYDSHYEVLLELIRK
jgi:hypothetical protein